MPKPATPYPHSDRELIRLVERSPSARAGYKQLVRELGLGGGRERRLLLEQLARITLRGDLIKLDTGHWSLPHATPEKTARDREFAPSKNQSDPPQRLTRDNLLAGKLDLHRDGFGFVRPNGSTSREDDLFIPPNELNGAMQGDEVLVDEAPPGRPDSDGKPRRSGRILRILTRRNPTVVGIFHYARPAGRGETFSTARFNYVSPLDERMTQPVLIPDGPDGQVLLPPASTEHRTLGEEARRTETDSLEGLAVDIEIITFPTVSKPAQGRILEVLGHPDDFGVDVEIVIRKHRLPYAFPAGVLAEASYSATQTVATLMDEELALRKDFRGLPIVTIDGETARDFDDAVLVQPLPNGNWQLQVHIADVSHYVRPGTALDLEARLRGTSVYFPDRAVPMLPPALSSGMCSLRPDEDRLVLSCIAEIDHRGEVAEFELCEGIIRSAKRFTYTTVQKILDGDPETRVAESHLVPAVEQMHALALLLNQKRHRRGSIDFDLPEPIIQFDPQGNMAAITRSERGWSNRLIEEFMLTANECVAHWLEAQGASIYRIHELPDPKRILDFEETAAAYGQTLGFSSLPVKKFTMKSDRRTQRSSQERRGSSHPAQSHDVPESIPVTPQMYQRLTAKIAGTPEERILSFLMLRSLKQARYSEKNEGHFALASPSYTHFTSPIRRYPDLIVHRLLRAALRAGASHLGNPILSTDPQPWSSKRPKPTHNGGHPDRSPKGQWRDRICSSNNTSRHSERSDSGFMRVTSPRIPRVFDHPQPPRPLSHKTRLFSPPRGTSRHSPRILPIRAPRRRSRARAHGMEEDQVHAGSRRRGLPGHHPLLHQVRLLRRARRPLHRGPHSHPDPLRLRNFWKSGTLRLPRHRPSHRRHLFRPCLPSRPARPRPARPHRPPRPPSAVRPRPPAAPQGEAPRSLRKPKLPKPGAHPSPTRTGKPAKTKSKARNRSTKARKRR